jgi:hypothetical protein
MKASRAARRGRSWAAAALMLIGGAAHAAEGPTGTVKGRVVDADTKMPLAGANVSLQGTDRATPTDAEGQFSFADVAVGDTSLSISLAGYLALVKANVPVRSARITFVTAEVHAELRRAEEVSVASPYFQDLGPAPLSVASLGSEEIRRAPGAMGDLSRALYVFPGVVQVEEGANDLIVRGGSPTENGFYIDGIPVPNINHYPQQGASGGAISMLNLDFVEDVKMITGGFGALYGGRLSAVVDIRFREGNRDELDGQVELNAGGFGGGIEGPLPSRRGAWMVSVRRSYLDLLADRLDIDGAPRFGDVQGKLLYDTGPRHRLGLLGVYGDSRFARTREKAIEVDSEEGEERIRQATLGLSWRVLFGGRGYAETTLSHSVIENRSDWIEPQTRAVASKGRYRDGATTLRNVTSVQLRPSNRVDVGLDLSFRDGSGRDEKKGRVVDVEGTEVGGSLSDHWSLHPRLGLDVGLRVDRTPYNGRTHASPRASATVTLAREVKATAALGVYRQPLTLFLVTQDPAFEALDDLRARHAIVGVAWQPWPDTRLTVEAYDKQYSRFPMSPEAPTRFVIDDVAGTDRDWGEYKSLRDSGVGSSRGIELMLQRRMSGRFYGIESLSLFRARYEDLAGVLRNRVHDNRYVLNLTGGFRPSVRWELSGRWVLAGGKGTTPIDVARSRKARRTIRDSTQIMLGHLPAYHSLNVRVDRRFHFKKRTLSLYVNVWNVYDHDNVLRQYWSARNDRVEAENQWAILPIIGAELEF